MTTLSKQKTITWLDRITECSLYALILTLPFSKSMVEIFFGCALVSLVAKKLMQREAGVSLIKALKPSHTKLNLPIVWFVLIGALSTIFSVSLFLSLEGFFFKMLEWVLIYFIVVETFDSKRKIGKLLITILLSAALVSINGVVQFITGTGFLRQHSLFGGYGIRSSFGNPNDFAGWLIIMFSLSVSLACFWKSDRAKKTAKTALWILTGLLAFCLVLTYSAGAWIAILGSVFFIAIRWKASLVRWVISIAAIALLVLFFIVPNNVKENMGSILKHQNNSVTIRVKLWKEAINIIEDFPVLGCGINTYSVVAPAYAATKKTGFYPHNSYLRIAAELGLLGLGAFIWILTVLFKTTLTGLKKINGEFYSILLTGLLAGLFGFLVHSFFDTNLGSLQLMALMWFIMGMIVAVQKIERG